MATDREALTEIARKLALSAGREYQGRWCFFAGFAFVLNGVEKRTYDIDVLTKDQETYQYLTKLLQQMGLRLAAGTKDYSSFRVSGSGQSSVGELSLDLLCITSEWLKPLEGMWTKLENRKVEGASLPVLRPIYLILLKIIVNSHRQVGDSKKQQDLVDVKRLMSIRGITREQVVKEAIAQELGDITGKFLDKSRESSKSSKRYASS